MALTIAQLVAKPQLATRIAAGRDGARRTVGWAHVCELADPWDWVGPGDLLMTTGLGIPADPDEQVEYVDRLADVGAAGVAVGENMNAPPLDPRMYAAADRRSLPLLLTRRDIPFIALARTVAEANARAELARIYQTEHVYEMLRRASSEDLDLSELLRSLEDVVDSRLFMLDAARGRSVVLGETIPAGLTEAVRRRRPGARDQEPAVLDVPDGHAIAVAVPSPRAAVLVAWARTGTLPDRTVLRHMSAATALHQTRLFAERERGLRLGAALLAQLLDQRISVAAARGPLATAGLGTSDLVLAACAPGPDDDLHVLHHHLEDASVPHLMASRAPLTYVLLPQQTSHVRALSDALPDGAAAGLSDPIASLADLPTAQRQARWALHRAVERHLRLLSHSDETGDSVFLPGDRDDGAAAARRVLGPLLEYDEQHAAHLVLSLRTFLEENRSWQRAAERLHVHKQTLVYRLRRVETLTSRRLSDTGDIAELWLALQAAKASGLVDR